MRASGFEKESGYGVWEQRGAKGPDLGAGSKLVPGVDG